jgi:hypothetical protein
MPRERQSAPQRTLAIAHHHPGRLRVRSRTFEWDEALREMTECWLAEQPGVCVVRSHAATGSMLVAYDPLRTDAGELLTAIAARARLPIAEPAPRDLPAQSVFDVARSLEERVLGWSGGRFGLGLFIPVALGVGSIGSFLWSAHLRAPRWDNLLYWGVQCFCLLNVDHRRRRRRYADGG